MPRAVCALALFAPDADIRADMRGHPIIAMLVEQVTLWQRWADEALSRGDISLAADFEERAAIGAHRLGLLEDALIGAVRRGCTRRP